MAGETQVNRIWSAIDQGVIECRKTARNPATFSSTFAKVIDTITAQIVAGPPKLTEELIKVAVGHLLRKCLEIECERLEQFRDRIKQECPSDN